MELDREEVFDVLRRCTPEDAMTEAALDDACREAVADIDRVTALAEKAKSGALGFHAQHDTFARFVLKELLRLRKNALRRSGSYRTRAEQAITL